MSIKEEQRAQLCLRSASVGVPATLVECKTDVDNRVVVQELAAHDPVSSMEARQVRADVADSATVIEISEECPASDGRSLRQIQSVNRSLRGGAEGFLTFRRV